MAVLAVVALVFFPHASRAQATLDAPAEVAAGANFYVAWTGPGNDSDQIVLLPQGAADRAFTWAYPAYPKSESPLRIGLGRKVVPGAYELRYIEHPGSAILARRSITIIQGVASLEFPAKVLAGSEVQIAWTGPGMEEDKIAIGKTGEDDRYWKVFGYTSRGNPLSLKAPGYTGKYEMRYYMGHSAEIITSVPFEIVDELPPEEDATLVAEADTLSGMEQTVEPAGVGVLEDETGSSTEQTVEPAGVGVLEDETGSSTEQMVEPDTSGRLLSDEDEPEAEAASVEEPAPTEETDPSAQVIAIGTFRFTGSDGAGSITDIGAFRFTGSDGAGSITDIGTFRFTGNDGAGSITDIGAFRFTGNDGAGSITDIGAFRFTGSDGAGSITDIGAFRFTGNDGAGSITDIGTFRFTGNDGAGSITDIGTFRFTGNDGAGSITDIGAFRFTGLGD